ncbi:MAG: sulfite exporter TauE/SafE family protein [Burkholderiaceae bacterium]
MSLFVLLATAGSLGLLGGLHCVTMCAALQRVAVHGLAGAPTRTGADGGVRRVVPLMPVLAPAGSAPSAGRAATRADLTFHAGRAIGYAMLGAAVGGGSWLLRWGADAMPLMRPAWGAMNVALLGLGLALAVLGRQPGWIDALGLRVWRTIEAARGSGTASRRTSPRRPLLAGLAWALVPCGLLYSALATAALASDPLHGAAAMLVFAAGTAVPLQGAQWLVRAIGRRAGAGAARVEATGVRIGGAMLAAMATAALVALALGQPHPFCVS